MPGKRFFLSGLCFLALLLSCLVIRKPTQAVLKSTSPGAKPAKVDATACRSAKLSKTGVLKWKQLWSTLLHRARFPVRFL